MLQAVIKDIKRIELREVPEPLISKDEVLIKVKFVGICGSDIHVYHGTHPKINPHNAEIVPGHEMSGEICAVGENIKNFSIGDQVTIQPQAACGLCYNCKHDLYYICEDLKVIGFRIPGTSGEYFAVNAKKVVKIPQKLSYEAVAVIEPVAVGIHAISRYPGDISGKNVLVLGAGTIGNVTAQAAKALGAKSVMMTDISDFRLEVAKQCGIDFCVNTSKQHLQEFVLQCFGTNSVDVIFECAGSPITVNQAIHISRKGISIILVGVYGDIVPTNLDLSGNKELSLISTFMYHERDFLTAVNLVSTDVINVNPIISRIFPLSQYKKAFEYIDEEKDKALKVLIKI